MRRTTTLISLSAAKVTPFALGTRPRPGQPNVRPLCYDHLMMITETPAPAPAMPVAWDAPPSFSVHYLTTRELELMDIFLNSNERLAPLSDWEE